MKSRVKMQKRIKKEQLLFGVLPKDYLKSDQKILSLQDENMNSDHLKLARKATSKSDISDISSRQELDEDTIKKI
jgi:hypothetical protein